MGVTTKNTQKIEVSLVTTLDAKIIDFKNTDISQRVVQDRSFKKSLQLFLLYMKPQIFL